MEGTPPTSRPGAAPTGVIQIITGGAGTGSATSVPPEILTLKAGAFLNGKIVARDRSGNPILQTPQGNLTLRSNVPLRLGAEVTLQIDQNAQQFRAHIVTIDGRSLHQIRHATPFDDPDVIIQTGDRGQSTQPGTSRQGTALPSAPALYAPGVPGSGADAPVQVRTGGVNPGSTLQLQILTPTPDAPAQLQRALPAGTPPPLASGAAGFQLSATVRQVVYPAAPANASATAPTISPPSPAPTGTPNTPAPGVPASASAATSTMPSTSPTPPSSPQAPGVSAPASGPATPKPPPSAPITASNAITPAISAAGATVTLPSVTGGLSAPPAPMPGAPVPVSVVASQVTGETILHTPFGTARVVLPSGVPVGTQLQVQLSRAAPLTTGGSTGVPAESTPSAPAPFRMVPLLGALEELNATLQSAGHAPATQATASQAIPQPGPKLGASMLFFLSALTSGDVRGWLGSQATQLLERMGKGQLLARLADGLSNLRPLAAETPQLPWQSYFIPILNGGQLEQVRLFVRRDKPEDDKENPQRRKGSTRFVVEVELSQFGPLQMDGLFRNGQEKQFQLLFRSQRTLPDAVIVDIRHIFASTLEATNIQGSLDFSVHEDAFPVQPLTEVRQGPGGGIVA